MPELYPLVFQPILRRYLWGGRRLASVLNKPIGDQPCAESWEVCDRGDDQSVVRDGPWAGRRLGDLVREEGPALLGRHHPQPQFPLLLKFLDAAQKLSLQVHPDDARAATLDPPDRGKTEAWVVLAAEPGSRIYAGLKRGFDRPALERELQRGTAELCLNAFEPRVGDCIFVPAGLVHALGAGLLVVELQQASDTTWRLYDWGRLGPDGQPRQLHIDEALEAIDDRLGPASPQVPQPTDRPFVERLVACEHFVWDRWRLDAQESIGGDDRFHLLAVLQGGLQIATGGKITTLPKGETALLPAALGRVALIPQNRAVLLDAYLP